MKQKVKQWAPCNALARRVARMLLLAHRDGIIDLGGVSEVQVTEWQFRNLTIGPRMKIGSLWRTHGRKILEHQQGSSLAPEQRETLEHALQAAS